MASFLLPSSIQKRLLRYALSKIEILDIDALDLKNLDIAWGTKSILEFKDTPLRLKVRTTFPFFSIVNAEMTYPTGTHQSSSTSTRIRASQIASLPLTTHPTRRHLQQSNIGGDRWSRSETASPRRF